VPASHGLAEVSLTTQLLSQITEQDLLEPVVLSRRLVSAVECGDGGRDSCCSND
jgi:hypothetical protein